MPGKFVKLQNALFAFKNYSCDSYIKHIKFQIRIIQVNVTLGKFYAHGFECFCD